MRPFDYLFIRAATFFYKRDGERADRALWFITAIQSLLLLDLYLSVTYFVWDDHGKAHQELVAVGCALLLIGLYVTNYFRYRGKYVTLREAFTETTRQRFLRGILIISLALFLFYYPLFFLSAFGRTFLNK
jgi:hypothetical protein